MTQAELAVVSCGQCGEPFLAYGRTLYRARRGANSFCSPACRSARIWSPEALAKRARAMKALWADPVWRQKHRGIKAMNAPEVQARARRTRWSRPGEREWAAANLRRVRHGNGHGPTPMEARLRSVLSTGWMLHQVVPTGMGLGCGYPTHYKLDLALPAAKVAVELDGTSHKLPGRRDQDDKKQRFLERRGWLVLRFSNDRIRDDLAACVQMITSAVCAGRSRASLLDGVGA